MQWHEKFLKNIQYKQEQRKRALKGKKIQDKKNYMKEERVKNIEERRKELRQK